MDWLTFIAEVIKAVAYPVAAIVIFLLLRDPLLRTIRDLKRLKWKEIEVEFDKEVQQAKEEARKLLTERPPQQTLPSYDLEGRLLSLVETSPKAAIFETWLLVEHEIDSFLSKQPAYQPGPTSASTLEKIQFLRKQELLDDHRLWLLESLRKLRNKAVHEREEVISEDSALAYISLASDFVRFLKAQS